MKKGALFPAEADLVAAFCSAIPKRDADAWTPYHETANWDLLLVHSSGIQIGVEAKLSLNPKVLEQALPNRWGDEVGPDYRAVLVPDGGLQNHMIEIARHLGIAILRVGAYYSSRGGPPWQFQPSLPDESHSWGLKDWPNWCPAERCTLPDYVPDVSGGHAAPVKLSLWKIKAIKLLIILERRGYVTRADMRALEISPTRWTDHWNGFLSPGPNGYLRNGRTPDLKSQHPTNWAQIEADFEAWRKALPCQALLSLEAASA